MDEFGIIQDYSMIDAFIAKNLEDYGRKLFGERDDFTGYFDEVDTEDATNPDVVIPDDMEYVSKDELTASDDMSEQEVYDFLFEDFQNQRRVPESDFDYSGQPVSGSYIPQSGNFTFKQNVSAEGLSPTAINLLNDLSKVAGNFVVTSGKRSKSENSRLRGSSPTSFHLTGQAFDLRPNSNLDKFLTSAEGKRFMAVRGYEIIDERNIKGVGAHWHLEPAGRKQAGGVPIAKTSQEQFIGLNDEAINELFLPLQGQNPIRGLDNGQPVFVEDDMGNSQILYGPDDVAYMTGGVYEKRLSKKYNTTK